MDGECIHCKQSGNWCCCGEVAYETDDEIELDTTPLDGPDFVDFEYWDETSQFDDHPTTRWVYGGEYHERQYRCRVPRDVAEADDESAVHEWIETNLGRVKWLG